MKKPVSLLSALLIVFAQPVVAEELRNQPVAVVELFTSQGCSSCPPADAVLKDISKRKDVIALAYHVDYWDYKGWPDSFGNAAYSDYQREYAAARGEHGIYTPQAMINGMVDVVGSRRGAVDAAIDDADLNLKVGLKKTRGMLDVDVSGQPGLKEAVVWLVTFRDRASVTIARGENRGKQINYTKIVTSRQVLGMWDPQKGAHIRLPLGELMNNGADGAAIIVQEEVSRDGRGMLPGRILGAASFLS